MKKETVKKLNDILDIADDIIDIDEPLEIQKAPAVEITTTDLTSDYDFSRDQYHNIIEKGNEALVELLAIAKEGEQPRAFEVATQLMNSLAATTKELLILQKTKKEVEGTTKPTKNENNLFIGSTSELQKLLEMKKKK
ncbi:MAG: terminase [Gammaproteobacteria bacterium]|nr:terminase [Gammaproteobacteria bacterium]